MMKFITSIDSRVLQDLYAARDPFLVQIFTWVSELATVQIILVLTAVTVFILAYRKRWSLAAGLMASVGGSGITTWVIKEIIARPRPMAEAVYLETTTSFPSSHANLVIAFYGFVLFMYWKGLTHVQRKIAMGIFGGLALAVGFSRLYLGVHYLSDVLAGYMLGCIFAYLGILVVKKLEERRSGLAQYF